MKNSEITETAHYLTFRLENEMFAIDVAQAREILDVLPITKVPRMADFVRGVMNVRGSAVPVVDLRLKFGLARAEDTIETRIVIIEIKADEETTLLGVVTDSVHEVLEFKPEQIESSPHIGNRWRSEFIRGIGQHNDEFIIIIDIEKVFSTDELLLVQENEDEPMPVQEIKNDTEASEPEEVSE